MLITQHERPRTEGTDSTWIEGRRSPRLIARRAAARLAGAAATGAGGFVVFSVVVWMYQLFTHQAAGYAVRAITAGAYLGLAGLLPAIVLVPVILDAVAVLRGRDLADQPPRPNEDVPAQPQPGAEGDPADGQEMGSRAPDAGAAHVRTQRSPDDRRGDDDSPADLTRHAESFEDAVRRVWHRRRQRVIGWIAIVFLAAVWEGLGLWPPHLPTLSHIVKVLEPPFPGGQIVVAVWLFIGGYLFGH